MKTKAQTDLGRAEQLVTAVAEYRGEGYNEAENKSVRDIYGGLCHKFPILVRTCGLCQTVTFSLDKATANDMNNVQPRNAAHALLLQHVSAILGHADSNGLIAAVRDGNAVQYMQDTRRVLSSYVYFKRFAVSILKVVDGSKIEDQDDRAVADA